MTELPSTIDIEGLLLPIPVSSQEASIYERIRLAVNLSTIFATFENRKSTMNASTIDSR